MAVYRYTHEGIRQVVLETRRTFLTVMGLAFSTGAVIAGINLGARSAPAILLLALVAGIILAWQWRSLGRRVEATAKSTEIEVAEDEIVGRNGAMERTIRRDEITEVRTVPAGILIKGRRAPDTLLLRRDLQDFDALTAKIAAWVPADVRRTESRARMQVRTLVLVGATLVLFLLAFGTEDLRLALPAAAFLSLLLLGCLALILGDRRLPARMRWMSLIVLIPISSAIWRAYLLWSR